MRWKGEVFVDSALPFGLRSAPKVFTAVADGLEWILRTRGGCESIHYLDDCLFMGSPGSAECAESLDLAESTCDTLGVPLALEKREGPTWASSSIPAMWSCGSLGRSLRASPGRYGMADEAVMHKKGAAVLNWAAATRVVKPG